MFSTVGHLFSVNIYKDSLAIGNVNSLTSVTVPRNRAVSVSSGGENKWGGVHAIITGSVCLFPWVMFLFHYSTNTANSVQ